MKSGGWRLAATIVLRVVVTLLFVPAILAKLRHPAEWGQLFATWGYPAWGPLVVSGAEILALLALWIPRLAAPAIGVLMLTLIGATATWLVHGPQSTAAYPGAILVLVLLLAWTDATARWRAS